MEQINLVAFLKEFGLPVFLVVVLIWDNRKAFAQQVSTNTSLTEFIKTDLMRINAEKIKALQDSATATRDLTTEFKSVSNHLLSLSDMIRELMLSKEK